jgi:hypothetical protein
MTVLYGNFKRGNVVRIKFNTLNQALIPTTPSVTPTFEVYKNSVTQSTAGISATLVDYDGKTGFHSFSIDTSADSAFYTAGEDYDVVFTAGTVDGKDLTRVKLTTFAIENRFDEVNVTKIAGQTANAAAAVTFPGSIASPTNITQATGVVLSSAGVQAIWDFLTSGILVAGSIGKQIVDRIDATISSRSTYAGTDTPGTTTLLGLITPQRALNLDFLDAASSSILSSISGLNNLSAKCNLFGAVLLEVPEAGSTIYSFDLVVKDDEDKLVNLDATPTITATNAAGTNRSANLSAITSPGTGRYRFTYTVASTHAKESLRIEATGTVSAEARYAIWNGSTVDYDTTSTLVAIQNNTVDIQSRIPTALVNGRIPSYVGEMAPSVITSSSIATSALNGKGNWALATDWTAARAGYLDGVLLAHNFNIRVVAVNGAHHIAADIHESQIDSIHPTSLEAGVYTTIVSTLLGTNHTSYTTPGTVGQSLNGITTLLTRIPSATAQLITDLALMLVGSGTALVKWTATALSLAPAGGGGGGATSVTPEAFINLDNTLLEKNVFTFFNSEVRTYLVSLASGVFDGQPMTFCIEKSDKTTLVAVTGLTSVTNSVSVTVPSVAEQTDKCMQWSLRDSATGRIILYGPAVQKYAALN